VRRAETWRLLGGPPLDGATNMAIEEAVLRARIAGDAPPTVRFFGWSPPAISLGYGQPLDRGIDLGACARLGIGIVRRPTGGSAILHEPSDREVTYSVVARREDFPGADDVLETYRVLATGLLAGLARLGACRAEMAPVARAARPAAAPVFCFARTGAYEIAVAGRKLGGSAQRRQGRAFLQHGAVLLDQDPERLRAVFPGLDDAPAAMTTLAAELGRQVGFDEVAAALGDGLAGALGVRLAPGRLSASERAAAARLVAEKYGTDVWTREGRVGVAPGAETPVGLAG
jgi:lipoyl(octanoyl) transferase